MKMAIYDSGMQHQLGGQGMAVPLGPAWHRLWVSCIPVSQLLGFSQDIKCLQIGWAA